MKIRWQSRHLFGWFNWNVYSIPTNCLEITSQRTVQKRKNIAKNNNTDKYFAIDKPKSSFPSYISTQIQFRILLVFFSLKITNLLSYLMTIERRKRRYDVTKSTYPDQIQALWRNYGKIFGFVFTPIQDFFFTPTQNYARQITKRAHKWR